MKNKERVEDVWVLYPFFGFEEKRRHSCDYQLSNVSAHDLRAFDLQRS
ncbi:MAG: hypothetical protein KF893_18885 [Caldilineaceae bacterium]|nr:hypothetical protein [Caldilineaceae bacterium]